MIVDALGGAGVLPLTPGAALLLIRNAAEDAPGAFAVLLSLLSVVDVLAAQTTTLVESGAARSTDAAAVALRAQAAGLRTARRAIPEFCRDLARIRGTVRA